MLLTIDVGNTNTVLGVFRGAELVANWRLTTARQQTVDEYGVLARNLFSLAGLEREAISGVIISSVVPPVNWTLGEMARRYLGKHAMFVEPGVKTGMAVLVDNPLEVGADRIVNGVAAFAEYGGPCIVVDFGTAITFDVISAKGEYLGGVIAPTPSPTCKPACITARSIWSMACSRASRPSCPKSMATRQFPS